MTSNCGASYVQQSQISECKTVNTFLSTNLNMCSGCSKEPSQQDGSFRYTHHMFWLRHVKSYYQIGTLIWRQVVHTDLAKGGAGWNKAKS